MDADDDDDVGYDDDNAPPGETCLQPDLSLANDELVCHSSNGKYHSVAEACNIISNDNHMRKEIY